MRSSHLILCHPLLLLPSIPPSIRVFSNESTLCMRWPEYWSFSFSISPSNEHPELISVRIDLLNLPWSPRDSQESSPSSQFKSIDFLVLSFLHGPTLISIHDHWRNHSLDHKIRWWFMLQFSSPRRPSCFSFTCVLLRSKPKICTGSYADIGGPFLYHSPLQDCTHTWWLSEALISVFLARMLGFSLIFSPLKALLQLGLPLRQRKIL